MGWRDTTTYSRGERGAAPREWRLDCGPIEIVVHRRIDDPGAWFVACHGIRLERAKLVTCGDDVEAAKRAATVVVRRRLAEMHAAVERVGEVVT